MKRLEALNMIEINGGDWQCDMVLGGLLGSAAGILTPAGPICIVTTSLGLFFKATNACG